MAAPLAHLVGSFEKDAVFRDVLYGGGDGVTIADAGRPFFLGSLASALERCIVAVVPTEADAEALRAATAEFVDRTALLSAWDVLPYEGLSPDPRISAHRLEALRLISPGSGARVVVASARAFAQKPAPGSSDLEPLFIEGRGGSGGLPPSDKGTIDRDDLALRLVELGYERLDIAAEPGTFAVRGGVVDIFPAQDDRVVRIELFGDDIESMRLVDPATQRSVGDATGVTVVARTELPPTPELRRRAEDAVERTGRTSYLEEVTDKLERFASGAVPEGAESLLPRLWDAERDGFGAILPEGTVVVVFDPARASDEAAKALDQEQELASLWADPARLPDDLNERPDVVRDEEGVLYRPFADVLDEIRASGREIWRISGFATDESTPRIEVRGWDTSSPRALLERCRELRAAGYDIVFCALPREVAAVGTRLAD